MIRNVWEKELWRESGTSYVGDWELRVILRYKSVIKGMVVGNQAFGMFTCEDCGKIGF